MSIIKYCSQCGKKRGDGKFCSNCGAAIDTEATRANETPTGLPIKKSEKSALTALLLCLFLGALGIHRFYVGKIGTGILMLLTGGGLGIWSLVDLVVIACGNFTDKHGNTLTFEGVPPSSGKKILTIILLIIFSFLLYVTMIIAIAFYATSGVVGTVRSQLDALKAGDYATAYSLTSNDFQRTTSFNDFKSFVEHYPALKNNQSITVYERKIENSNGTVKGNIESTDGTMTAVEYHLIKENGKWKIIYINIHTTGSGISDNTKRPDDNNTPSTKPANTNTSDIALPELFDNPNSKYSIRYPADWEYTQPDAGTVVIGGKKGLPSYESTLNIQTILTKKNGGKYNTLDELMNSIKKQIMSAPDINIIVEDYIKLEKNANRIGMDGKFMVFTYTYAGKKYQQMQFVFINKKREIFYAVAYTSPAARYEIDYPTVKAIFGSWRPY